MDSSIANSVQILVSMVAAFFSFLAYMKAHSVSKESKQHAKAIEEVRHLTNSLSTERAKVSREAGMAEGDLKGRADQTEERRLESENLARQLVEREKKA